MKFEGLFQLIHSMSESRKRNFTRYTIDKSNTLPILLYKRIITASELTEETLNKIKGEEFASNGTFCNNRNDLIKLIIRSFVHYEAETVSVIPYIRKAFLFKAIKLGIDTFNEEVRKALNSENFSDLIRLYDLADELKGDYEIIVEMDSSFPTLSEALAELAIKRQYQETFDEISCAAKKDLKFQKMTANKLNKSFASKGLSRTNQVLWLKLQMNLAFLRRDLKPAFEYGQRFFEELEKWPEKYPNAMLAIELSKVALQAAALLEKELTLKYTMRLAALSAETPHGQNQIQKSRLTVGATASMVFGDLSLAKVVLDELQNSKLNFPERLLAKLYHSLGRAFFFNADYKNAIRCFQITRNSIKRTFNFLKWEPQAFLAIARYELGDYDDVESLLRSALRAAKALPEGFPVVAVNLVSKYCQISKAESHISLDDVYYVKGMADSEIEQKAGQDFPIDIWLESKASSVPLKQVLEERIKKKYLEIRNWSEIG
jgi:hypothetical protein